MADPNIKEQMIEALHEVLSYPSDDGKGGPLLVQRIPLICQDIRGIRGDIAQIHDLLKAVQPLLRDQEERAIAGAYAKRWLDRAKWLAGCATAIAAFWALFIKP